MIMKNNKKSTVNLSTKHFSRYGEFLVSFELSKYGWNVYNPVYDEYIDLLIHKHVCNNCGKNWNLTPALVCKKCGKDFSKTQKNKIVAKKICQNCRTIMIGNKTRCTKCKSEDLINIPSCDKCGGEVDMKPRDLIKDEFHFYIWCLIDDDDRSHFLVLSVKEFVKMMGESIKGISFFKDQDRQHFSSKDFGRWKVFL